MTSLLPATLAAAALIAGADPAPVTLAPSGKWVVDYNDNMCLLYREFGTADDKVVLGFRLIPNAMTTDVIMLEGQRMGPERGTMTARVEGSNATVRAAFVSGPISGGRRITRFSVDEAELTELRGGQHVTFMRPKRAVRIDLTSLSKAIAATKHCTDDLLIAWKIDPQVSAKVTVKPKPATPPQSWVTDDDYPPAMLSIGAQGVTTFRLDLDATGRTTGCGILVSSGQKMLDESACKIMRTRARFEPARTSDGTAVPYVFVNRFSWRIP